MTQLGEGKSKIQDLMIEHMNKARDSVDEANIGITLSHHEVHHGRSFTVVTTVAAGASRSLSFKTGTTKQLHLVIGYASESTAHIEYKEGVAITATTGTEILIINRDRNSATISTVLQNKSGSFVADNKILIDATTVGGTVISTHVNWSDKKYGASRRGLGEYILKEDTQYEFILTSDDGAKGLHIELNWYEV